MRRLRKELPQEQQESLVQMLWPFRKRATVRSDDERARLEGLLAHSPALAQAHTLREALTRSFDTARSKAAGFRRIRFWRKRVERSGLGGSDAFLKRFDNWQEQIANDFVERQSSGFVEGLNNKLKVRKRRWYGLRNIGRLFQRLTLDVDGYRRFSPWPAPTFRAAHGNS